MTEQEREKRIHEWAQRLYAQLQDCLPSCLNEADLRNRIDPLLDKFCVQIGLNPMAHAEYSLATGRADAVFNRLVIEYERPGVLKPTLTDRATQHAVEQVKRYMEGIAKKDRHAVERLAGVAFDGKHLIFVRSSNGSWAVEPPVAVNEQTLARFLRWLSGLASGIALTPENLNRDFALEQSRTQNILHSLYHALNTALEQPDGLVSKLFEQWQLFFSQAIDYSEAFGGRKLEPLQKWVRRAGIEIKSQHEAERFFFALHTYFALLVKLLAWQALSRHLGGKISAPIFSQLLAAEGEQLRERLQHMEDGAVFRTFGILNLLEGDFFAWYLHAWNSTLENALRAIIRRLDEYDPATLSILPEETRDLFKKLYHYLLPREVRHNLGEYYTPDWLAQRLLNQMDNALFDPHTPEPKLRQKLIETRWLDPACGSGTFLVLLIARMQALARPLMLSETELLEAILQNVVGFDINPLAVLTARVNYLLAIADLLEHRRREVSIPVYLADSVLMPAIGRDLFVQNCYLFPTAVGVLMVPRTLCTPQHFDRFCDLLEECLRREMEPDAFLHHASNLGVSLSEDDHKQLRQLYKQLLELHRKGLNGLWARLLKNNFAPITVGAFDYIVGNPPWVNWEHLPDRYRENTKDLWSHYQLAGQFKGGRPRLGTVKVDLSALMTYVVMDKLLKRDGKLGFVITQSLLKTAAGAGFRRFKLPDHTPLKVVLVDDMVALNPFEGASNRTAVIILQKGRDTRYPIPYTLWRKVKGEKFTYDSTLDEVKAATRRLNLYAEPVDPHDPTSQWLTARPKAIHALRKVLGQSAYKAHEGVNTGGANGVYWVEQVMTRPDGLIVVRNLTEGAKRKVDEVTEPVEPHLLYPLLRGRDVQRWRAEPSAWIIVPQNPHEPSTAYPEVQLQKDYPRTYGYLKRFEKILRERSGYKQILSKREEEFYGLMDIDHYTFTEWKVVWREQSSLMTAAVVGAYEGKLVIPDHKLMLIDCASEEEAHYLCALLNSSIVALKVLAYAVSIQMDPHILERLRIPRFDPQNPVHRRLAELSARAHQIVSQWDGKSARSEDAETVPIPKEIDLEAILPRLKPEDAAKLLEVVNAYQRAQTELQTIEQAIDEAAAQVWGLTDAELREIQQSLKELSASPDEEETSA
ncbi:MAG: N-6 DNA methylase [Fimbriimonadales bacterium]|jgi:methylase of polypeptide subunit release factors|nr:N-6 DNA methylase [Armatimonadota bacterium]MCX7688196.1 N-6 DNA methylase [Fimbriimonadales bacterium]GBC90694.1 hypothetical protein HRbin14_01440 [bacterium HR14]CUU36913.1 Methyltransferase domain-containing protein [Armatimonadetes bacterium DC]